MDDKLIGRVSQPGVLNGKISVIYEPPVKEPENPDIEGDDKNDESETPIELENKEEE